MDNDSLPEIDGDEELAKDVFAHFGLAMFLASVFEHGTVNALAAFSEAPDDDEWWEGHFSKTLGRLLHLLTQRLGGGHEVLPLLRRALERRNFLAHSFWRERAVEHGSTWGRISMLEELRADQQLFQEADAALSEVTADLWARLGVTSERIEEAMERLRRESEAGDANPA